MFATKNIRVVFSVIFPLTIGLVGLSSASAQRGRGGGARPSLGHVGSNGARSGLPNFSRPSMPSAARPSASNFSRPSFGNMSARPSTPDLGNRPGGQSSIGGSRPSLGGVGNLPSVNRPATRPATPSLSTRPSLPSTPNRPTVKPPQVQLPTTRPSTGIGSNRPAFPEDIKRPSLGNVNRPTTLPGVSPRPGVGGNRPTTLPGNIDRPVIGGNRPNVNLPNINRPNVNKPSLGNDIVINRPSIGGHRPAFGNDTNINIGNQVNIGSNGGNRFPNRPNWDIDPGFSRPSWGLNSGNNWNSNWHNNCINHHHNWYNGCWHGYWGSSWYAPVVWGGIGWGLGSITNSWGYGYGSYYNPYYAQPVIAQSIPFDYSQPIVVNNYVSSTSETSGSEGPMDPLTQQQEQAFSSFDQGLEKFKAGQYVAALSDFNASLKELPGDAVVHEVRCLALFATGQYQAAAAGLNSLLAAAPGMDWTTMSGLYGNPDDYVQQLRKLEQFCKSNPTDASAHFVLAYHYLVTDSKDAAIRALQVVVQNQPKDVTAKRMLDAMMPAEESAAAPPKSANSAQVGEDAPETDLVGTWLAQSRDSRIELAITEDSQFTWKAETKDQTPIVLSGRLVAENDGITLETQEAGSIGGTVESKGPDNWRFAISGAPSSDPGLMFARIK